MRFRRRAIDLCATLAVLLALGSPLSQADQSAIKRIDHVGISTADIGRSIHFYRDLLGMELVEEDQIENQAEYDHIFGLKNVKAKSAVLRLGAMEIELFEFERPRGQSADPMQPVNNPRIYHICFEVTDVQREYQRLKDANVPFISAPQDFGIGKAVYGRDPDGNVVELLQWTKQASDHD